LSLPGIEESHFRYAPSTIRLTVAALEVITGLYQHGFWHTSQSVHVSPVILTAQEQIEPAP
jgi:hypothetical protein